MDKNANEEWDNIDENFGKWKTVDEEKEEMVERWKKEWLKYERNNFWKKIPNLEELKESQIYFKRFNTRYDPRISDPISPDEEYEWWSKWLIYSRKIIKKYEDKDKKPVESQHHLTIEKEKEISNKADFRERIYSLKEDFIALFDKYSFENQGIAEAIFHTLIGTCFKDKTIKRSGKNLVLSSHSLCIQNSGSGKDEGLDFVEEFIKKINKRIRAYNASVSNTWSLSEIRVHNLSGQESPEVMCDQFPVHPTKENKCWLYIRTDKEATEAQARFGRPFKVGDELPPIPGILSKSDILVSRECSHLFDSRGRKGKGVEKVELLLQTLEGRGYEKSLIKWEGRNTITYFNGGFIGTSRPVTDIKETIAESGFQQRSLNILRDIDNETRQKMQKKVDKKDLRPLDEIKEYEAEQERLTKEFVNLRIIANNTVFEIEDSQRNDIISLRSKEFLNYFKDIQSNIINDMHRGIMESFIARYAYHVTKLSYHYALIRTLKQQAIIKIDIIDVKNALNCIRQFHDNLLEWVQGNITENPEKVRQRRELIGIVTTAIRKYSKGFNTDIVPKIYIQNELIQKLGCSRITAHHKLQSLSQGDYNLLEKVIIDNTNKISYKIRQIIDNEK